MTVAAPEQTMTREEWLQRAAEAIAHRFDAEFREHFGQNGIDRLSRIQVSTGFPSSGGLTKVIGECWKAMASDSGEHHHVFINPRLDNIVEVIATLAHEMVHAADDCENKHRGPFLRCVRDLGLEGKATATYAGAEFAEWADAMVAEIGDYPHIALTPPEREKKQGTRMLKLEAPCCGYAVRTTRKWIDEGLPSCPCGTEMIVERKDEE